MPDAPAKSRRRLSRVLLFALAALALLALALYASRRIIAREALIGWLKSRGIAAEARLDRFGLGALSGRVRIGDPAHPDFTAADLEATYGFRGLSVELRSVTLKKPVLRAKFSGGKLTAGSLDPLIEEIRRHPPPPNVRQPRMRIEDGVVLLATDYGPLRLDADLLLDDGKLMSLNAVAAPATLKAKDAAVQLGRGTIVLTTRGPRTDLRLDVPITRVTAAGAVVTDGHLHLTANAPYPDLQKERGDGQLTIAGRLTAARATAAAQDIRGLDASVGFSGQVTGWITTLVVAGKGAVSLSAASGDLGGGKSGGVRGAVASDDLRWSRQGGDRLAATVKVSATGERFTLGGLTLEQMVVGGQGPVAADAKGLRVGFGGSALGRGRWKGLGDPREGDGAQLVAIKKAARGFRWAAPSVQAAWGPTPSVRLVQPLTIRPDSGGELRLAMSGPDAARITVKGGGLPDADASLTRVRLADGRAEADLALKAGFSIGPLEGGEVDGAGHVSTSNGVLTFAASRCATFQAAKLEFGESDVEHVSGRLCPAAGGPLFAARGGDFRLITRIEDAAAEVPLVQVRLTGGAAAVTFRTTEGGMSSEAAIEAGQIADTTPEARFNPVALRGRATLAADVWNADLDFATPAGAHVATARVRHEMLSGKGGVDIDTGRLVFADPGLQPAQLSPLASALGSPATGAVSFQGGFAWLPGAGFSAGTLKIERLDFVSPAGPVKGLSGELALTSLAPLLAKPGQQLHVERLDALVPILDAKASIEIRDDILHLTGGEAVVEGGLLLIESLDLPMTPDAPMKGVLRVDGVQLKNLVEASPFAEWMDLDARVSGRIPFETEAGKVRIASGNLEAIAPGRLTIARQLFTGGAADVKADSGGQAVAPDPNQTFTDMAYQAMEDLAFSEMGATINSLPNGRLGVLFHIKGRHDPPQKKQIKLSMMDLIRQRFMGKPLPLPTGTEVNLTLDTTLNLDDLLADYAEFNRTRGSAKVQP